MNEREAYQRGHPPACTCVDCSSKRIQRTKRGGLLHKVLRILRLKR